MNNNHIIQGTESNKFTEMAFFFPFENTALHLAAIQDHPDVVSCLLASDKQEILMNKKNQNVLNAAMEAEQKRVLLAIASHKRWEKRKEKLK